MEKLKLLTTKNKENMKNHKHYKAAYQAYYATSFSPEKGQKANVNILMSN